MEKAKKEKVVATQEEEVTETTKKAESKEECLVKPTKGKGRFLSYMLYGLVGGVIAGAGYVGFKYLANKTGELSV